MSNLFGDLSKHLSERHEDFLTNSFVYLINYLLENENLLGIALLNFICFKNSKIAFTEGEQVIITTQKSTDEGTPDIEIKSAHKWIYIEVKHDSPLGNKQIERYRKALEKEDVPIKKIVLLTRLAQDFEETKREGYPDEHIRWYQIHHYLEKIEPNNTVGEFLVDQFKEFLEDKQMAIQKVNWEYTNGIRAFDNLINMIGVAIEELGIKIYSKSAAWDWKGYYLEDNKEFCGIYYSEPDAVYYELINIKSYSPKEGEFPYPFYLEENQVYFELSFEDIHFFSLQKNEQLDMVKKFVAACHSEAIKLKKPK